MWKLYLFFNRYVGLRPNKLNLESYLLSDHLTLIFWFDTLLSHDLVIFLLCCMSEVTPFPCLVTGRMRVRALTVLKGHSHILFWPLYMNFVLIFPNPTDVLRKIPTCTHIHIKMSLFLVVLHELRGDFVH